MDWPQVGDGNETEFGGVRFDLDVLKHWNYTYYSNGTLSNGSRCYLTYEPYQPALLYTNGSFVNATKCYSAVDPIELRGFTGIGIAVAYGIALVLTVTVLTKHGKTYLPKERRFYPIGRRWQWYWAIFVCACALISLFINVDVDRYHVQELPIVVMCFFWFLLCQGTTAIVWEAVRHWGSWQERQYIDPNPFSLAEDDRRAKVEFYLPLWFYLWLWLVRVYELFAYCLPSIVCKLTVVSLYLELFPGRSSELEVFGDAARSRTGKEHRDTNSNRCAVQGSWFLPSDMLVHNLLFLATLDTPLQAAQPRSSQPKHRLAQVCAPALRPYHPALRGPDCIPDLYVF